MNKKIAILSIIIFMVILITGFFVKNYLDTLKGSKILSPVPNYLTSFVNKEVSTINLWLPSLKNKISANFEKPEITATSALIFDISTGKVIYAKDPQEKLPMASLTKIATAIIALENKQKQDEYKVTTDDLVGEDSMGLEANEVLSEKELLYGLMLHSGNDAAETFATNFKGGRSAFIKAMNEKVKSLGLKDTNFTNPTGLEGDGIQYTTSYDLVVLTKYAIDNFPLFSEVVSTFDYIIPKTLTHKEYILENETNLLTTYPGVKGIKTGYTPEAGYCLVTYLDYEDHKIIGVILGSEDRRGEMIELLDYSLKTLGISPPEHG